MSDLQELCLQFLQTHVSVYSYRECVDIRLVAEHFNFKLLVETIDRHCGRCVTQVNIYRNVILAHQRSFLISLDNKVRGVSEVDRG